MIFATGADEVPPCGFVPVPLAELCANSIELPTWPDIDVTYDLVKEFMDDGIQNSPGFGRA